MLILMFMFELHVEGRDGIKTYFMSCVTKYFYQHTNKVKVLRMAGTYVCS